MKVVQAKPATTSKKTNTPFFNKEGSQNFFTPGPKNQDAFFKPKNTYQPVQNKLNIGRPDDHYEHEADAVADKVVQRLSEPTGIQKKTMASLSPITPLIQNKCAGCEHDDKLKKKDKEEDKDLSKPNLQRKPIFESNAVAPPPPPVENKEGRNSLNGLLQKKPSVDNHVPFPGMITNIQSKAAGEKEEQLRKKEKEDDKDIARDKIQKKPIFESNATPPEDENNIQRKGAEFEKEEKLQKTTSANHEATASPNIESGLSSSKGSGSPLPQNVRSQMESSFGTDFSQVKIHNDSMAAKMSEDLNAQAFTHGNDIYFNSGKYNTSSSEGSHLLAHELTHTVQQGGGLKRKESSDPNLSIQKATAPPKLTPVSSGIVDISSGQFLPSEKVKAEIDQAGDKGLDVRVIIPKISLEGKIKVRKDHKGNYDGINDQPGYLPVKNAWADKIGGLFLIFHLKNSTISNGYVSTKMKGNNTEWIKALKANAELLGAAGLKIGQIPKPVNDFSGDSYKLGVNDLHVVIGGFVDAKFSFTLENATTPKVNAAADINVKGIAKGQLNLDNTKGPLTGEVSLVIEYKDFTGNANIKLLPDGSVDIRGKAAYNANKLSGEIEFVSTDLDSAKNFAKDAIKAAGGIEKTKEVTEPPPLPVPKEGKKERALAATGHLQFNITKWFAGTVNVIVDGEGHVTVIGKIAPPAEVELFKQKDYDKEIISLQVEAGYGIPVIGTIGVFAGVILSAVAYIGPAKLYNIEIEGTYSTNPTIQKNIQISASLNISAYAGLRLRAEGGAKLTILKHDLKIGVGVNADVGVKAYADARPTIGYRDPGEFYISGTAELVAQPMLGLSGDFFIELKTPWWSPLDDDRWVWPIGSKEWPLTDPIGLNATMKDYVLGSGVAPDIEFKKPEFNPSKFMTSMVDKQLPDKSGAGKDGKGGFKEDPMPVPEIPDKKAKKDEKVPDAKTAKGTTPKGLAPKKTSPDPKAQQEAIEIFNQAAPKLKDIKAPLKKGDLKKQLDNIEHAVKGIQYHIDLESTKWVVTSTAKGVHNPKPVNFAAIVTDEDKKAEGKEGKKDNINIAIAEIIAEGKKDINDGLVTSQEAKEIKDKVNADHSSVIQITSVTESAETWDYEYIQKKRQQIPKGNKLSKYVNFTNGKYILKPDFAITTPSEGTIVRNRFYGTSYRKNVRTMKDEQLATIRGRKTPGGFDGLRHPTDRDKYWWNDRYWLNKDDTRATIEHKHKVVDHWNEKGRTIQQPGRLDFYSDTKDMEIQPSSENKRGGSDVEVGYKFEVGKNFRGPNDPL